ncbi:RnfH family protein [Salinicola halophilus]|uniref:RnfH family protein n=1 Tax=Salinicola halophilus TaxID=184065 RepID=UPI000DA1BE0A|nr:RnfH family protein [Salinicola halophilus]
MDEPAVVEQESASGPEATFEVVFATPERQEIVTLPTSLGLNAREAVIQARLETRFQTYSSDFFRQAPLGTFGVVLREPTHYFPAENDRIEVYRPLEIDPKQARRERAAKRV